MTPEQTTAAVVDAHFPTALAAFLGGSAATALRTSTSDLDIVVVLVGEPAPYRETMTFGGWLVELFVQSPTSMRGFWDLDALSRRPPLLRMCAEGVVLRSVDGEGERIQREAGARLEAGPVPLTELETASRRYALSDLLDDLRDAADSNEPTFIANAVLSQAAGLALLTAGRWLGTGKWLAREMDQVAPELLSALTAAHAEAVSGDVSGLVLQSMRILEDVGGPLSVGFRADGQLPTP
jgi:hypothetical protein